jgi:hypothetical protein
MLCLHLSSASLECCEISISVGGRGVKNDKADGPEPSPFARDHGNEGEVK